MRIWEEQNMLEVSNLTVGYGGMPVVQDVSFNVEKGKIIALIGSNGAGKTTTLKAVCGLLPTMAGEITFEGKSIVGIPAYKILQLGISMVPEGRLLFGKMSVENNLIMGAYLNKDKDDVKKKLSQIYELFPRIHERLKQTAETLSGGEQQMVAFARGLMSNPKLIILDEPSLGLMPKLVIEVFEFTKKIRELGITVILVEQNINDALAIADYAYVIQNGKTVMEATGAQLKANPKVKKAFLGI
jgi:branched-chain amino acid transport system ATP-binding protein